MSPFLASVAVLAFGALLTGLWAAWYAYGARESATDAALAADAASMPAHGPVEDPSW